MDRYDILARDLAELRAALLVTPRLTVKDMLRRYGWSRSTLYRRSWARKLPPPAQREAGRPLWRLADLVEAESRGVLSPLA